MARIHNQLLYPLSPNAPSEGSERLCKFPKVIQLLSSTAAIKLQSQGVNLVQPESRALHSFPGGYGISLGTRDIIWALEAIESYQCLKQKINGFKVTF